jgi:hypothetical protein
MMPPMAEKRIDFFFHDPNLLNCNRKLSTQTYKQTRALTRACLSYGLTGTRISAIE